MKFNSELESIKRNCELANNMADRLKEASDRFSESVGKTIRGKITSALEEQGIKNGAIIFNKGRTYEVNNINEGNSCGRHKKGGLVELSLYSSLGSTAVSYGKQKMRHASLSCDISFYFTGDYDHSDYDYRSSKRLFGVYNDKKYNESIDSFFDDLDLAISKINKLEEVSMDSLELNYFKGLLFLNKHTKVLDPEKFHAGMHMPWQANVQRWLKDAVDIPTRTRVDINTYEGEKKKNTPVSHIDVQYIKGDLRDLIAYTEATKRIEEYLRKRNVVDEVTIKEDDSGCPQSTKFFLKLV